MVLYRVGVVIYRVGVVLSSYNNCFKMWEFPFNNYCLLLPSLCHAQLMRTMLIVSRLLSMLLVDLSSPFMEVIIREKK